MQCDFTGAGKQPAYSAFFNIHDGYGRSELSSSLGDWLEDIFRILLLA